MDPKELEEKLERDNLTLKEHIMKLQNTIKQIKSEIVNNPENICNVSNTGINNGCNSVSKIKENQRNKIKSSNDLDEKDNYLKFSFNNNNNAQTHFHSNSHSSNMVPSQIPNHNSKLYKYSEDEESHNASFSKGDKKIKNTLGNRDEKSEKIPAYKNVYQSNLEKLRKEKEIIQQMENFKKNNLKKKFDDDELDENEVDKFHENYKNIKNEKFRKKNEYSSEDDKIDNEKKKMEPDYSNTHVPVFNNSKEK